jgi:peptidoglycan L-alanyl-D-glutamate endopeptidase CwlK
LSATLSKDIILFRQRVYCQAGLYSATKLDGDYGKLTAKAESRWDEIYRGFRQACGELDGRSERCLYSVLPKLQSRIRLFLTMLSEKKIHTKVLSGTRTYAEQNALYAQGRTKPGDRVTKARGGFSNHNFGCAIDIGIFTATGKYLEDDPLYDKAVDLSRQINGLAQGADWPTPDRPHYELDHKLKISEVRRRFEVGELIYVTNQ